MITTPRGSIPLIEAHPDDRWRTRRAPVRHRLPDPIAKARDAETAPDHKPVDFEKFHRIVGQVRLYWTPIHVRPTSSDIHPHKRHR